MRSGLLEMTDGDPGVGGGVDCMFIWFPKSLQTHPVVTHPHTHPYTPVCSTSQAQQACRRTIRSAEGGSAETMKTKQKAMPKDFFNS